MRRSASRLAFVTAFLSSPGPSSMGRAGARRQPMRTGSRCVRRPGGQFCGPLGGNLADDLIVLDSVTHLGDEAASRVVVAASHAGGYAAVFAAARGVRAVVLNDAGIGKDEAGIAGLALLDEIGVASVAIDYRSARIGDGQDMIASGVVSHVNATARDL